MSMTKVSMIVAADGAVFLLIGSALSMLVF